MRPGSGLGPIGELLGCARELWERAGGRRDAGRRRLREAIRLLQLAHILAVTPSALERLPACA